MQFSTVFATVAAAALAVSAAPTPRGYQDNTNGMLTWYAGESLAAPACGGAAPNDWDLVVAVQEGAYPCNTPVHIHYNGKMVPATVRDYCAGCDAGHLDATKGVFAALAPLDQGELYGVHIVSFN